MSKLYELTGEMLEINAMLDCGELSYDDLKDQIEATSLAYEEKCRAVVCMRQNLLREAEGIQAEIDRLTALQVAPKRDADWLEDYLKGSMLALGMDKIDLGIFKITLRKATVQLGDIDETKIPSDYFEFVPATTKLDKRKLLADAKLSPIEGVTLGESKRGLTIK
jgi:hypothetical protein